MFSMRQLQVDALAPSEAQRRSHQLGLERLPRQVTHRPLVGGRWRVRTIGHGALMASALARTQRARLGDAGRSPGWLLPIY